MRLSSTVLPMMAVAAGLSVLQLAGQSLQLVSGVDPAQGPPAGGSGDSSLPIVSPDGRYVLFASTANNLLLTSNNVPMPEGLLPSVNVFLRDRSAGSTTLVSVNLSGVAGGNGDSVPLDLSTNGRYALFQSSASDLVTGDTNGATDVFVRDLLTGSTLLVSMNTNGVPGNGPSRNAAMTPDGQYVCFVSAASDLVPGDTNGIPDVFVRDLTMGVTVLASVGAVATNRSPLLGGSDAPQITPDGRYVAFFSTATNLVAGVPPGGDVYVRDLTGGSTTWASVGARAALQSVLHTTNAVSYNQSISADGQFVAYEASSGANPGPAYPGVILRYELATALTKVVHTNAAVTLAAYEDIHTLEMTPDGRFIAFIANTNGTTTTCVQLWDANSGSAALISGDLSNSVPAASTCDWPTLGPAGQFVMFLSSGTNLTTNVLSGDYHIYLRDTVAGTTTLLDADTNSVGSPLSPATVPRISPDGRFVVFECADGRLVPNDRNHEPDVFLVDRLSGSTEIISARHPLLSSSTANGQSTLGLNSATSDGRYLVFASQADNLAPNDTNGCRDIFLRDLNTGAISLLSVATNGAGANGASSEPAISADGRLVAFSSTANNLVLGDANRAQDVFVRDLLGGTNLLVSINSSGTGSGNGDSYTPRIGGGRYVLFRSTASNLAPALYQAGSENLFVRDLQAGVTYVLTTAGIVAADVTPDGRFVALVDTPGASSGSIYVWDSLAGVMVATNATLAPPRNLAISPDGNRVVYWGGTNGFSLLAWDRLAGTNGVLYPGLSPLLRPVLRFSRDGQFLAYTADATNQVYLYDFQAGSNYLVSRSYISGLAGNGAADSPDISADGRFIAYRSAASDIVAGDTNGVPDIFLYDRQTGSNALLSLDQDGLVSGNNRSLTPVFSGDGRTLFFESWASDVTTNDFNHSSDLFAYSFLYALILPSGVAGQGPWLSWPYNPGRNYSVQFKNNLSDLSWQTVSGVVTNAGNRAWLQDAAPDASQRFYRVVGF